MESAREMSQETQTGVIRLDVDYANDEHIPTVVSVNDVSMVFNMASQQLNSLKEYLIAFFRHELMFKEFRALNDVSFDVKKGDVFGILGTNGSGKSTLLKIISGVLNPTEGSVEVKGKIAPLIEMAAGFDMELTGRENIYLNGSLLGHSRKYIDEHFDEIVDFAEIEGFLDMPVKNYSSGMVSRIAFAIATVMVPDILIVDEVLSVGDFMFQEKCEARIQDLIHNHGVTVLIVSHSIDQIERLCNRAIWIEKSHPRMIGDAADVARVYKMLGGHKGSAESEETVLSTLLADVDRSGIKEKVIAGASRYDTAIEILELCEFDNTDTVIVTNSDNTLDRIIGLGLAGAMKCPIVSVCDTLIPDAVGKALRRMGPSSLVVLDVGSTLQPEVLESLCAINEDDAPPSITELFAESPSDLAELVRSYAVEHGVDVKAYPADPKDEFNLVSLSPVFYEYGIIVKLQKAHDLADEENSDIPMVEDDEIAVAKYGALSDFGNVVPDLLWTTAENRGDDPLEHVFVTSHNPSDSLSAAMYIAQKKANMVLLNHRNLDNFANAIELVRNCPFPIERLTFIGDDYCFTPVDREVLAKAIQGK